MCSFVRGKSEQKQQISSGDMSSRLFIAKAPSFSDLEVVKVELFGLEGNNGPLAQVLKAKCRELARADGAILVSPTTESMNAPFGQNPHLSLWVTAKKGYMDSAKSKQRLHLLGLKVVHRVPLSRSIIQACYQFSIMARLAPKWNKVSSWLIKGSEFLTTGKAQALSLEVGITVNEITLNLIVRTLSFSPFKVEDLNTTTTMLNTFRTDPHFVIPETSIYSNRCLLLPNFSVGYIFSVSHQIPPSHEFPSYDKVRLHWKKQHGIILPETQNLFYQVFFKFNSQKFFSYPGNCVFKSYPLVFPSREVDTTAASFVADIHARLPTICGEPVKFSNKALVASAELSTPAEQTANRGYSNTKPVTQKIAQRLNLPRIQPVPDRSKQTTIPTDKVVPSQASGPLSQSQAPNAKNPNSSARIVPIFNSKPSTTSAGKLWTQQNKRGETTSARNDSAVVPTFKPKSTTPRPSSTKAPPINPTTNHKRPVDTHRNEPPPSKRLCLAPPLPQSNGSTTNKHNHSRPQTTSQAPQAMLTQQVVPDLNTSLHSIGPQELSFTGSPHHPKPAQKQVKPKNKAPPKQLLQVDGVSSDVMAKIHKSKAGVLRKWLQENGVKCRSKDKKDDLARLVAEHIKQSGKTFVPLP